MATCTYNCLMSVINIGNSIIGVSILAMPYCFRKCGILLSVVLIFVSGLLTRLACYLLLKSAIMARRRNFEYLAFHTFGLTGKLAVEMSVIGFLIGVCIAFFVVIGDLGPPLAADFLSIQNSPNLRTNMLMLVGLCIALPLGMLRKIDSLTSLSALSIAFYACLILKIFVEALPNLAENEWWYEVNWWRTDGILPCLPIFSMALSCQTQLFEFFDPLNDPSLKRMQSVIAGAVHLCSAVYIMVGTFGYIAFHDKAITGNALTLLSPTLITELIKLGFILTVAVSFPLCLFPCRSSLHSLLFKQGFGHHDINVDIIPDHRFRILTISLVIITIGVAIMLPNIEFVLGIIGSTIGTLICLIFPAIMFIHDTSKNTTEKRLAQVLMSIGTFILIACTYSTLRQTSTPQEPITQNLPLLEVTSRLALLKTSPAPEMKPSPIIPLKDEMNILNGEEKKNSEEPRLSSDQKRQEPPIPQEPESKNAHNADLDPQALQKEDKEIQKDISIASANEVEAIKSKKELDKQEKILQKLEEQHEEQKQLLEEQKKVLEELKRHKESHEEQWKVEEMEKKNSKIYSLSEKAQITKNKSPQKLKNNKENIFQDNAVPLHVADNDNQVIKSTFSNKTSTDSFVKISQTKNEANDLNKKIVKTDTIVDKVPKNAILKENLLNKTQVENNIIVKNASSFPIKKENAIINNEVPVAKKPERHKSANRVETDVQNVHVKQRETLGEKVKIEESLPLPKKKLLVEEIVSNNENIISTKNKNINV